MSKKTLSIGVLAVVAAGITGGAAAAPVTLTIESWRNDDLAIWRDKIIPAFEKQHPDIKVRFSPTAPTEYNAALNSKLDAGTAGDLVTCRPFDASLQLFQKGRLAPLNDLKGMQNFTPVARTAWSTDDGKTTFCVPMASVIHGFIYNKDLLSKAGVTPLPRWMNSSSRSTRSRPADASCRWPWERRTVGKPRAWATRTSAPTTTREKKVAPRCSMARRSSQTLSGSSPSACWRSGSPSWGRASSRKPIRQPEPVHARARRHLSRWLVGDLGFREAGQVQDGRLSSPGAQGGRQVLHL
jgi:hypothetical protein